MLKKLRNIGVIAHVDAGKTTLTERILFVTGAIHKSGDVDRGNTTTDSDAQEKARGITIGSAAITVGWRDHRINIIDTPGHIDFNIEVNRSLRVLDGAVVVFDAVAGVEPQSETNWRLADKYHVPRLCVVNKMDRVGANFYRVVDMIRERLNTQPLVTQIPVGAENDYEGLIDLVSSTMHRWDDGKRRVCPVPAALSSELNDYRNRLLATLADHDLAFMERYIDGLAMDEAFIRETIRRVTLEGEVVPVLCASAYKFKGVESLLDSVVDYLPSPTDIPSIHAESLSGEVKTVATNTDAPFSALAFKEKNDKHGSLTYLRVYSGRLERGASVLNANTGQKERIGNVYEMRADKKVAKTQLQAGDIVAVQGFKTVKTGHSLCDQQSEIRFESIVVPKPVIDVAVEAARLQDQNTLSDALRAVVNEDPSLRLSSNISGQTLLSGMGELHLDVALRRLKDDYNLEVRQGKPEVAYRETLTETVEVQHLLKKQTGGPGQYARFTLRVEPLDEDEIVFESLIVGGKISKEYIASVEKGIKAAARNGVLAGYPCGGFRVTLVDGDEHENDSSQLAFETAAREAFQKAGRLAAPRLLEPIMQVEVTTPQQYVGDCIGDINRRRGVVTQQEYRGNDTVITAVVPLARMFGYIGDLRTLSAGRAGYSMRLERYALLPESAAADVLARQ